MDPYKYAVDILRTNHDVGTRPYNREGYRIRMLLEDTNSPVTRKYQEKLFKSVMEKGHVDFGNIPQSKGDIKTYTGYANMVESLSVLRNLANENHASNVLNYIDIVETAVNNIAGLAPSYKKGFAAKSDYVMMEYCSYVYFCIEATTALIYSFVDVMKDPTMPIMKMTIKNTKLRADEFYFDQLRKYNNVQKRMGMNYRKMLDSMCKKNKDNFIGADDAIYAGIIIGVILAIVPVTREVIYQIYHLRGKLSNFLDLQADFLEMNKTCVETDSTMTATKKREVLKKQQKLIAKIRAISNKLRVKSTKSVVDARRELDEQNNDMSVDSTRGDVSDDQLEIL